MMLRIAIQKSGRLFAESMQLLADCGITVKNGTNQLKSLAENFPLEVYFLRDDDIPQYVEDGVANIGIVGQNVLEEKNKSVTVVTELGFGKCRLSIAVPKAEDYAGPAFLDGKKIATSYPGITSNFLQKERINAEIHEISGSVELAPGIGLAEAICDLVSSGSTLLMNGLREVQTIMQSQAVLIRSEHLYPDQETLLRKLLFRIEAVRKAKKNKYILLNAPNDSLQKIFDLLPGIKSPTVMPLANEGWSSVHSVLHEDEYWEKIEALRDAGAQGILVIPIDNMII